MKKNIILLTVASCILSLLLTGCGLVVIGDKTPLSRSEKKDDFISEKDATEIVADHFSLDLEQCIVSKCELDDGIYEIVLFFEDKEYEAEVDARSGKIFDADVEREDKY